MNQEEMRQLNSGKNEPAGSEGLPLRIDICVCSHLQSTIFRLLLKTVSLLLFQILISENEIIHPGTQTSTLILPSSSPFSTDSSSQFNLISNILKFFLFFFLAGGRNEYVFHMSYSK